MILLNTVEARGLKGIQGDKGDKGDTGKVITDGTQFKKQWRDSNE